MSNDWVNFFNTSLVPLGLMLIMFSLGLTLALRDFGLVLRSSKLVGAGFFTHLVLLPLLGLGLALLFQLPPPLALGLFIISLCPAGTTSNGLTFVGGGNVALAVILTALTSLVTVFSIPLLLNWAVPWFLGHGGGDLPPDFIQRTILQLVRITVLPMGAGMLVRHFAPNAAANMARWLRPTAFVILIAVILMAVLGSWQQVMQNLLVATPAILTLNLCAMGLGLLIGRLLGADARDSMTLSIETGVQNVTLALVITLSVLGDLSVAVTQNIYGVLMIFNASLLIRWWRRRIAAEARSKLRPEPAR
jgi:bile acid:Na+ symporter, BASS family